MKCPKCGMEIPFYDLKPNCKHCGVNILYYTQNDGLMRDAKRTELEAGVARMVIARIKAEFIGGKLQVARLIAVILSVVVLMIPYAGTRYHVPLFEGSFSVGIIGLVQSIGNGMLLNLPKFIGSSMFSKATLYICIVLLLFIVITIFDLIIFGIYLLGFLSLTRCTKAMKNISLIGAVISVLTQIAVIVLCLLGKSVGHSVLTIGFGALASFAVFLVMYWLNSTLLKKGIEPTYREFDPKRKELLKKVRTGEVNLDDLPIPIFESESEHEERLKALEEALKAEEEGKEL
ncbi:MAG: hypothetical protein IKR90_00690 [Clostridia bacterium]|nr:hypothetical protein [Clostridia bacterium]